MMFTTSLPKPLLHTSSETLHERTSNASREDVESLLHLMRSTSGRMESRLSSSSVTQPATARAAAAIMLSVTWVAPATMQPSPMPAANIDIL